MTCEVKVAVARALLRFVVESIHVGELHKKCVTEWCTGETCYTAEVASFPTVEMDSIDSPKIRAEFWLWRTDSKAIFGCWMEFYPGTLPGFFFNCVDRGCPTDIVMEGLKRLGL